MAPMAPQTRRLGAGGAGGAGGARPPRASRPCSSSTAPGAPGARPRVSKLPSSVSMPGAHWQCLASVAMMGVHGSIAAAWGSVARPAALTKALLRRTAGFVLWRWLRAGGFAVDYPSSGALRPRSPRDRYPDFRSGYAGSYAQGTTTAQGKATLLRDGDARPAVLVPRRCPISHERERGPGLERDRREARRRRRGVDDRDRAPGVSV